MLASIRLKYWPIGGRSIARDVFRICVICFRLKPVVVQPIMGDLPTDRVEPVPRAFYKCGVDLAGPIMIRTSLLRRSQHVKGYIVIFVCFVTRAVHIELVSNLSTKAFLNALNRFFDRRGKSHTIYSDNATNFVGAQRHLKEVYDLFYSKEHQDAINTELSKHGVQWRFIPARSPHFGGLWERAVRSMKNLLYKVMGESYLTYEELTTVLTRAEACLNSRPITPLSNEPFDLSYLSPGHFLIGDSLMAVPEPESNTKQLNRLDRWQRVTQLSLNLWKRRSKEYLGHLQERVKWAKEKGPRLNVGTVVLLRDDNLPPLKWSIGRIVSVREGRDGVVRSAFVRAVNGEYERAVRQLCLLPFEGNNSSPEVFIPVVSPNL
ncbi:uncharacterized protein LOC126910481 [Daktulosphaira vitifoliae]|uniref:uncharacterized protein LOC126910481 n=1 Tax=Daktulosphaira vitifoliae TaxID=58002 RepID=UPI0021AAB42A|nr:uncharacterized protein LOC126910481 [Daktulosphaira vitifoliae]